jgi:hypothetical protein
MRFILQKDLDIHGARICAFERNAVRHAALFNDSVRVEQEISIRDLRNIEDSSWSDLADQCPVGSVDFAREWMRVTGVTEPEPIDYPESLLQYGESVFGRTLCKSKYADVPIGDWIKPVRTKAWQARRKDGTDGCADDEIVWHCRWIQREQFIAEWRVYVLNGAILGVARYDENESEIEPDAAAMLDLVHKHKGAPSGYAMDVAWIRSESAEGRLVVVEINDGWSLGYYKGTCSQADYARLLATRWGELCAACDKRETQEIAEDEDV